MSNSNLSFKFRKPQVQKFCFIPPKIIFIKVHFGSEKILGLKEFMGLKNFGSRIFLGPTKILGPKKFWDKKYLDIF